MEEIITVNGQQYKINTSASLTQEQLNNVIRQLQTTQPTGCLSCGGSNNIIASLAVTCPPSPGIKRGTTKNIVATVDNPTSLTFPWTYKIYTYGSTTAYASFTETVSTTYSHTFSNVPFNTNTDGTSTVVKLEVTDSCVGSTFIGTSSCGFIVADPILTTVTVTNPNTCKDTIRVSGATCQLGYTCTDQFGGTITCTAPAWTTTPGTGSVTVSAGLVTGVTAGTATVTATTGGKSGSLDVTVLPATCTTPTCGFTIT